MRALVAGWFSFELMGATAGDLIARDVVRSWFEEAGIECDLAVAPPFTGGVDWRSADPARYSHVAFVCGPFGESEETRAFLARFPQARLVGVNLSMNQPVSEWNPFHVLLERDSDETARPELAFLGNDAPVPVVGVVLVHPQNEYGKRAMHAVANAAVERLTASRPMATVPIDTRLDIAGSRLRTPAEVESLIARMDVIVTTRLHGMVLALKNGVPVIAVDPIRGGAKVRRQAETIGWPLCFTADSLSDETLAEALETCLTEETRQLAKECGEHAKQLAAQIKDEFALAVCSAAGAKVRAQWQK